MKIQYKPSTKDSRFLEPMNEGMGQINVLNMSWTLSPKESRDDVPYVMLKEYQQTTGQLIASLIYYGRVASRLLNNGVSTALDPDKDPFEVYKYKYFAEPTGFVYKMPYFNNKKLSRKNSFGETNSTPFSETISLGNQMLHFPGAKGFAEGALESIAKVSSLFKAGVAALDTMVPGRVGFETPKSWSESEKETYTISFDLFNTGTVEDIENNRNLCHLLSYQNSPSRRNFAIIDPPVIYSLTIPDVVQFPACWMSDLDITNLGNTRTMYMTSMDGSTSVPRIIPEAYRISMTFTSLLLPSRNILLALDKGKTVEAISDIQPFQEDFDALRKTLFDQGASPAEKQKAADILDGLNGYTGQNKFAPGSLNRDLAEFG